jgi:hypothetical protein
VLDIEDNAAEQIIAPLVHHRGRVVPPIRKAAADRQTIPEEPDEVRRERGTGLILDARELRLGQPWTSVFGRNEVGERRRAKNYFVGELAPLAP